MNSSFRSDPHSPSSSFSPLTSHRNGKPQTIRTNEGRKVESGAGGMAPFQNSSLGDSYSIDDSSSGTRPYRPIATPSPSRIISPPRTLRKSPLSTTKTLPPLTRNPKPNITPPSRPFSPVAAVAAGSQALRSFFSASKTSPQGKEKESMKGKEKFRLDESTIQGRTLKWGLGRLGTTRKAMRPTEVETIRSPLRPYPERKGTWQPPSLSKGSISQPQLRLFLDREEADHRSREKENEDDGEGTYGRLGLISGRRRPTAAEDVFPPRNEMTPFPTQDNRPLEVFVTTPAGSSTNVVGTERAQKRSIKRSLSLFKNVIKSKPTAGETNKEVETKVVVIETTEKSDKFQSQFERYNGIQSNLSSKRITTRPTTVRRTSPADLELSQPPRIRQEGIQRVQPSPTNSDRQLPPRSASATPSVQGYRPQPSPSPPTGSRASSKAPTPLSEAEEAKRAEDHYMLRIAVVYLVRTVLPHVISKTSSSQTPAGSINSTRQSIVQASLFLDGRGPLKNVLEERLRSLQRMERAWGSAWIARGPTGGALRLSERTALKERKAMKDALRDGVVLC